jgi:hypothetical protein
MFFYNLSTKISFLGHKNILHPFRTFAKTPAMRFLTNLAVAMHSAFNVWAHASRID